MFFILSRVTARGATVVTVPFLKTTPKAVIMHSRPSPLHVLFEASFLKANVMMVWNVQSKQSPCFHMLVREWYHRNTEGVSGSSSS